MLGSLSFDADESSSDQNSNGTALAISRFGSIGAIRLEGGDPGLFQGNVQSIVFPNQGAINSQRLARVEGSRSLPPRASSRDLHQSAWEVF